MMFAGKFLSIIGDRISESFKLYIMKWIVAWDYGGLQLKEDQWWDVLDGFEQHITVLEMITMISLARIENV